MFVSPPILKAASSEVQELDDGDEAAERFQQMRFKMKPKEPIQSLEAIKAKLNPEPESESVEVSSVSSHVSDVGRPIKIYLHSGRPAGKY